MEDASRHEYFMRHAIVEAEKAVEKDEVPVGAVIVYENRIIARAHNQREILNDPTAHAEMIAITQAAAYLENWRLAGTTLYVTLEPCAMVAGALVQSRIDTLVYGTVDKKAGACTSVMNLVQEPRFNHRLKVIPNILAEESKYLLQNFPICILIFLFFIYMRGEVSERPNERAWKARIPTKSVSRVRLPPSPPV